MSKKNNTKAKSKIKRNPNKLHHAYDRSLKRIFSHPLMMESLIKGFVPQGWVKDLDFTKFTKINIKHVTADLREREDDVIWRVDFKNQPIYLIFLLELQSTVNKYMAVRLITYTGLIYEDLIKEGKKALLKDGSLPPIFSFVYYHGEKTWTAPLTLRELYNDSFPKRLLKFQPNIEYMVIDLNSLPLEKYAGLQNNFVLPLIELERSSKYSDSVKIIQKLINILRGGKFDRIRSDILVYVKRVMRLEARFPGINIHDLEEVPGMLSAALDRYDQNLRDEGVQQGIQQGVQQGIQQGVQQGIQQGVQQGIQQGVQQGIHQERLATIKTLCQSKKLALNLSQEQTIQLLNASTEQFNKWMITLLSQIPTEEIVEI